MGNSAQQFSCRACGAPGTVSYWANEAWKVGEHGDGFVRDDEGSSQPELVSWCENCAPPTCTECGLPVASEDRSEGWLEPDDGSDPWREYYFPDMEDGGLIYKHGECGC